MPIQRGIDFNAYGEFPNEPARDAAIAAAMAAHDREIDLARAVAAELARMHPERLCWADRVGRLFTALGLPWQSGWTGGLFRDPRWENTGKFVKSKRRANHARIQWVFRLVGSPASDPTIRGLVELAEAKARTERQ
jgi:hypothetical protein